MIHTCAWQDEHKPHTTVSKPAHVNALDHIMFPQVLMAQLKSPEELHYPGLSLGDPMMGRAPGGQVRAGILLSSTLNIQFIYM